MWGGDGFDYAYGIAVDSNNNICVVGQTDSDDLIPPDIFGTFYKGGTSDGFATRLSANGAQLWSVYLGGLLDDICQSVTMDSAGNPCVTGHTSSTNWVFSKTGTIKHPGSIGAFVTKLSASSGSRTWTTFVGGGNDNGRGIATDSSDNIYVVGDTHTSGWASGGFNTYFYSESSGTSDGFLVKLSSAGQHSWSTYLGDSGDDVAYGVACGAGGNVFVTGKTHTTNWFDYGFDTAYHGGLNDTFLVKASPNGRSSLEFGAGRQRRL